MNLVGTTTYEGTTKDADALTENKELINQIDRNLGY